MKGTATVEEQISAHIMCTKNKHEQSVSYLTLKYSSSEDDNDNINYITQTHWLTPSQGSAMFGSPNNQGPTNEQKQKSIAAASTRTKDPLQSWTAKRDDCPICMLTLPISVNDTTYWGCCGTTMCEGCQLGMILKSKTKSLTRCPFCNANPFKSNVKSELALAKKGRHMNLFVVLGTGTFGEEEGFKQKQDMAEGLKW